ncbi:hypothetical protein AYO21_01570 [Fonsecaea monophora]|uniref:Major facilitator superfamily (MFS) profile domain-containing protein n=1 Tax=Fonsecaea monophora TaxID=254056 RepID=A0A177FIH6_9EURO|nr:hypothetical protein AYO21_01570 [Fonsecaea monophora]KAH0835352.1 putative transporter [Fonsecaea pedrosoi]OAG44113.1 hypothetical protein AYO21_01570 [Fonsecaea monophora]
MTAGETIMNDKAQTISVESTSDHVGRDTSERERILLRKLDVRIIPMIMWMYLMSFMDRVNIGNARLYDLEEDLGLVGDQYQLAVSILFVTYCLFELPSNLIIKKLQPARYLAFITFAWGVVATLTGVVQNFAGLIACRLLLGLFEAGLFPGLVVYLTMFYTKRTLALRTGYLFATAAIAGAVGGLLAYAIGFMDGVAGMNGWRWIMIIEGIPTVITGCVVYLVLPNTPETAKFLSEEDRRLLTSMHDREVGHNANSREFHWSDVRAGLKDKTIWLFGIAHFCLLVMLYSFNVYLPSIINDMGQWSRAETQALTIPIYALGGTAYLAVSKISDNIQRRGIFIIGFLFISMTGYACLISNTNVATSFAGCFLVALGAYTSIGLPVAWLGSNYPRFAKRATASALQLTLGNAAGVAAPFLYTTPRAPEYYLSYGVNMGLLCISISIYTFLLFYWRRVNKRRSEGKEDYKLQGKTEDEVENMGDDSPHFRFTI